MDHQQSPTCRTTQDNLGRRQQGSGNGPEVSLSALDLMCFWSDARDVFELACSDPLAPGQKHQERLLPVTQAASGNSAGLKAVSALTSKSHLIKKVKNTPQGTRNKFQTVTDLKLLMRNTVWSDFIIQPRNGVAKVQGGSRLSNMCDLI